ncbi:MAG: MBL fold metallo-hydrolase, partial [Thermoguttaceae bacterium]|nr:MBL fold metallo-hydrolase [Thermoguttaceae bacterium]
SATVELAKLILYDSAHIQEEDVLFKQKRHKKETRQAPRPGVALYNQADVDRTVHLFKAVPYDKPCRIAPNVEVVFHEAGHVLGSSFIEVVLSSAHAGNTGEKCQKRLLFSGDLGRSGRPILRDPELFNEADHPVDALLIESTYGNKVSAPIDTVDNQLTEAINRTVARNGKVIMPVFAVERAQEILYRLHSLIEAKRIPGEIPIFLDSPMAVEATEIFMKHPECFDQEMIQKLNEGKKFQHLSLFRTSEESRTLNSFKGSAIIMSSAGMCNAGRIKHHLANHIGQKENTILFLGYQAAGTLGRQIVDGVNPVRILGEQHRVRAEIVTVRGISGHADQNELLAWFKAIPTPPKHVFVVHGEPESSQALARSIKRDAPDSDVLIPRYRETVEI